MEGLYLVEVVKEFQDGEDAGSYEETHLTPDVACGEHKQSRAQVRERPRGTCKKNQTLKMNCAKRGLRFVIFASAKAERTFAVQ